MVDTSSTTEPRPPPRPRWVKIFGIVAALLIAVVIVAALAGGDHGPARHVPGGDDGGHTPNMEHSP